MRKNVNVSDLEAFRDRLLELDKRADFAEKVTKRLAARLLRKVILATPVSTTKNSKGKAVRTGGTLRRGWTANTEAEAANGEGLMGDMEGWLSTARVKREGDTYTITISNPVHYAPYVEYGHRTVNGGWVEGQFMMTIAAFEIDQSAERIIKRELTKYLKEVLNAK